MNASTLNNNQTYINLFFHSLHADKSCTVIPAHSIFPCSGNTLAETISAVGPTTRNIIVVLDAGQLPRLGKLSAYIARPKAISAVEKTLESFRWNNTRQWAIYPSAVNISVVYERNSAAEKYAQNKLIPPANRSIVRLLKNEVSRSVFKHPDVELVALTAER